MTSDTVAGFEMALAQAAAEIEQLRTAVATAYGYLWHVNNEPGTPNQYPPERAAYEARKILRGLMTNEQRGEAINRVREVVDSDLHMLEETTCGCREGECESKSAGCRMAAEVAQRDPASM